MLKRRLTPLFGIIALAALARGINSSEALLDDPKWNPSVCTQAERGGLLSQWRVSERGRNLENRQVEKLYRQLGDESFAVREAASKALLRLGSANIEALQRLCETDNDPERTSRVKVIIVQWRRRQTIRLRNVFRVWLGCSEEAQLEYAPELVAEALKLPATMQPPGRQVDDGDSSKRRPPRAQPILLHYELLPGVVSQLKKHETAEAKRLLRSFLREDSPILVLQTMKLIGSPSTDPDAAIELMRLAEGANKDLALRALSHLSNWHASSAHRKEITAILKRLYESKDEEIALQAAIMSCYTGDWSGFPRLLDATKSPDKSIAMKAIGQLVDCRYKRHGEQVVPLLLPHLKSEDPDLLNRTIETLGNYRGTAKHVLPFLEHVDDRLVWRAILALGSMDAVEAIEPLKALRATTEDKTTRRYIDNAVRRLEVLR